MLFPVLADSIGWFAINEFRAMKAAQGKHLCRLLFSFPASLTCAGRISWMCVCGIRAALQPTQLKFCSPQYLGTTDAQGLHSGDVFNQRILWLKDIECYVVDYKAKYWSDKNKWSLFVTEGQAEAFPEMLFLKQTPCKWFDMEAWICTRVINASLSP